ncbi:MAG: histidine phosphatase family protein [Aquabacterium sp.]|nr:histidine phosphatase family protein [Aquabacterium sp.]
MSPPGRPKGEYRSAQHEGPPLRPPLQIYFIRHGETAWSLSGQHTGRTDLPLTPHGETMARGLATALTGIDFSHVLTSPRLRARATCALAGLAAGALTEPDLAEWDYGDYEGLRTAEIQQQQAHWDVWRDGCPGGETPADISARADRLIGRLRGGTGTVALFSHGQFGRAFAARWIGLLAAQGQHFAIGPASISILSFEVGHPRRPVIALWNAPAPDGSTSPAG